MTEEDYSAVLRTASDALSSVALSVRIVGASGTALDFPFRTFIFSGMSMALPQSLIQEFLTWISPNIILSGQVDLIING